jgi:hypothetical protein
MNKLNWYRNELKNNKWLLFILPPFTGLFIAFYSWMIVSRFVKLYISENPIQALADYQYWMRHFDFYVLAWIIAILSLLVFGVDSIFNVALLTVAQWIYAPFKILIEMKSSYVMP